MKFSLLFHCNDDDPALSFVEKFVQYFQTKLGQKGIVHKSIVKYPYTEQIHIYEAVFAISNTDYIETLNILDELLVIGNYRQVFGSFANSIRTSSVRYRFNSEEMIIPKDIAYIHERNSIMTSHINDLRERIRGLEKNLNTLNNNIHVLNDKLNGHIIYNKEILGVGVVRETLDILTQEVKALGGLAEYSPKTVEKIKETFH